MLTGETQAEHIQEPEPQATFAAISVGFYQRILSEFHTQPAT